MSCENVQEQIISGICGELSREEEAELRAHLESCDSCRQTHGEFRSILSIMQQMPRQEWNETLHIRDLLRRDQRWRTIVFSKAALWLLTLTAFITVISFLPIRWQISDGQFSIKWGETNNTDTMMADELRKVQQQLLAMQKQNEDLRSGSETRIRQMLDQNNIEQQRRYFQTLEMFTNYLELQHQADVQKIQRDIATTYNRTGEDLERTNELLQYVLRTSGTAEDVAYAGR